MRPSRVRLPAGCGLVTCPQTEFRALLRSRGLGHRVRGAAGPGRGDPTTLVRADNRQTFMLLLGAVGGLRRKVGGLHRKVAAARFVA
jgi:hypothetical protein